VSTILVVEDEGIVARDIQRTLTLLGYSVPRTARSGAEALSAVDELVPDLVLMDIKLKGKIDGIETTTLMQERWDIPVIYLTAHADDSTLARAKETAPQGYLLKPFNPRELRTAIEVGLRKHELERKLAERERWFSTTLASIGDAIIATTPEGSITFMNPVAESLTGWLREDAQGKPLVEVLRLVGEDGQELESPTGRAIRGRFRVQLPPNTRLLAKQGQSLDVDDSATAIVDDRGRLLGGVVVFRDVTERKKTEERLALAERLASIGTMAAGTAHEINNPLAAVVGNVAFANERLAIVLDKACDRPGGAEFVSQLQDVREALSEANQAAERVRRIVLDLKKFARTGVPDRQVLELSDVLESALKLADNQIRHRARLRREYQTTPLVDADEGQLVQVFTNLMLNAGQAIGDGTASENEICIATMTGGEGRAIVEVRDTGCGIPKQNLNRVFDPFFSTKSVGDGMGLGLSICHGIITSLGGELTVESEVGRGTTFRVALPPATRPRQLVVSTAPVTSPARRGRVLVIDDDEAVGRTIERVLCDEHDVVVELDPVAAVARIASGESFDVVFCDLMMPGMNGADVYAVLSSTHPELVRRIVFLTGGPFSQRGNKFLESITNPIVSKPFTVDSLRALVCDYLR
jgi:PAS domain S-box-containing protein